MEVRDIIARTRRFAHLIVSCADQADTYVFDVLEEEKAQLLPGGDSDTLRLTLYRSLCGRVADGGEDPGRPLEQQPVIRRFYSLPVLNRMAFALIVIEEFPSDAAADILQLPHQVLEEKIHQSRRLLFDE